MGIGPGNVQELFSVPVQQIASVVVHGESKLNTDEIEGISKFLHYPEIKQRYHPHFADSIKDTFNLDDFLSDKAGFLKLWVRLCVKYPAEDIDAFLNLNTAYWYPDVNSGEANAGRGYIETCITQMPGCEFSRESKLPGLLEFYKKIACGTISKNVAAFPFILHRNTRVGACVRDIHLLFPKAGESDSGLLARTVFMADIYGGVCVKLSGEVARPRALDN